MIDPALRPMSNSQLLDRTFQIYIHHFFLLAGIALPAAVFNLVANVAYNVVAVRPPGIRTSQHFPEMLAGLLGQVVAGALGQAVASGATAYAVSAFHLGRTISISDAYRKLGESIFAILKALALVNFRALWLLGGGLLLAAIGAVSDVPALAGLAILAIIVGIPIAIVMYCTYALAVPACAIEKIPAKQALIRSKYLTESALGRVILIYFLGWIISSTVQEVLNAPVSMADRFGYHLAAGFPVKHWAEIAEFLAGILAGPVATIGLALLYYDQRVRKEAFDIQLMMEALVPSGFAKPTSV